MTFNIFFSRKKKSNFNSILNQFFLISSDLKLYGSDALQSFCGVASKKCTPYDFGKHIGLTVRERPFDIYFKIQPSNITRLDVTIEKKYINSTSTTRTVNEEHRIVPMNAKFHRCNESYQYGEIDYGAKCSCKACQSSCEIHDEVI